MKASANDIAAGSTRAMTFPEVILQLDDMLDDGVAAVGATSKARESWSFK